MRKSKGIEIFRKTIMQKSCLESFLNADDADSADLRGFLYLLSVKICAIRVIRVLSTIVSSYSFLNIKLSPVLSIIIGLFRSIFCDKISFDN